MSTKPTTLEEIEALVEKELPCFFDFADMVVNGPYLVTKKSGKEQEDLVYNLLQSGKLKFVIAGRQFKATLTFEEEV